MKRHNDRIHDALDNPKLSEQMADVDSHRLEAYRRVLARLENARIQPSDDLFDRIIKALPEKEPKHIPFKTVRWIWTPSESGFAPVLIRAAAIVLVMLAVSLIVLNIHMKRLQKTFVFHAPNAYSVELVGTFNQWQRGSIALRGPDADGNWVTTIKLPAGRHEYMFVVDKTRWLADPNAKLSRPDGFGGENSILEI
ncbi:MAG: glycogen-binding domain-containing protein [Lentisphaerae bacterium]|nr:glycogen-binding domain-containing protein [Lentisphaerota bacterium]